MHDIAIHHSVADIVQSFVGRSDEIEVGVGDVYVPERLPPARLAVRRHIRAIDRAHTVEEYIVLDTAVTKFTVDIGTDRHSGRERLRILFDVPGVSVVRHNIALEGTVGDLRGGDPVLVQIVDVVPDLRAVTAGDHHVVDVVDVVDDNGVFRVDIGGLA